MSPDTPQQDKHDAIRESSSPESGGGNPWPQPGDSPKNKKLMVIVAAVVAVLIVAVGAYFLFFKDDAPSADTAVEQSQQSTENGGGAIDVSTLQNATFTAPPDLNGFQLDSARSTDQFKTHENLDLTCELAFGTVSPEEFPGDSPTDIVNQQLQTLSSQGFDVDEPTAADPLVLTSSTDASQTYTMPTLIMGYSNGDAHALAYYSIAFLQNGRRAIVYYLCANETGEVSNETLQTLKAKAEEVTISPEQ